jgi:acetyltransferase-like isoleucine patch superfamily enzyme
VFTGPYVYITDQNHGYTDPDVPVGRQWPVNEPVVIGSGCWLGAGAIILPGARLGRNVVVAGGAVVRGEFPDHSVIAGVPAKVVRRYDPASGWFPALPEVPLDDETLAQIAKLIDDGALTELPKPDELAG